MKTMGFEYLTRASWATRRDQTPRLGLHSPNTAHHRLGVGSCLVAFWVTVRAAAYWAGLGHRVSLYSARSRRARARPPARGAECGHNARPMNVQEAMARWGLLSVDLAERKLQSTGRADTPL